MGSCYAGKSIARRSPHVNNMVTGVDAIPDSMKLIPCLFIGANRE